MGARTTSATEDFADGLMAETDAEDRDIGTGFADEIEADTGLMRRAGAGRNHDGVRPRGNDLRDAHLVVAMHVHLGAQFAR